jgi:hypothetical protein
MKNYLIILAVLAIIVPMANGAQIWNAGAVGNWSDANNWGPTARLPRSTETAQFNTSTCTLDSNQTIGQYLGGNIADANVGYLELTTGANLTVSKSSSEIFTVQKVAGAYEVVDHSAGTLKVSNTSGTGEFRLVNGSSVTSGSAVYNLSGTAVLDTEILSKGLKTANAEFIATGGTLVIRNKLTKFGIINDGWGFDLGQATLEIGAVGTVGAIALGDSSNKTDLIAGYGATIVIDIADANTFDKITQYGGGDDVGGATLVVNLLNGYDPNVGTTFDILTLVDKSKHGTGTFGTITPGFDAQWVDTDNDANSDTLRLTVTQ